MTPNMQSLRKKEFHLYPDINITNLQLIPFPPWVLLPHTTTINKPLIKMKINYIIFEKMSLKISTHCNDRSSIDNYWINHLKMTSKDVNTHKNATVLPSPCPKI